MYGNTRLGWLILMGLLPLACQVKLGTPMAEAPATPPPETAAPLPPAISSDVVVETFPTRKKPGAAQVALRGPWLGAPKESASGELEVRFLDVGQGDTTLIKCPDGNVILIDVGGAESPTAPAPPPTMQVGQGDTTAKADAARAAIEEARGGKPVHALFLTHPDRDHYNGLGSVYSDAAEHVFIGGERSAYKTPNAAAWLKDHAAAIVAPPYDGELQGIKCGGAKFTAFLADPKLASRLKGALGRNASSIGLSVSFGEADFVFTGDLVTPAKANVLERLGENAPRVLDAEVLKLAHHGAENSFSQPWFDVVRPFIAVASSRVGHRYGHPRQKVVDAVMPFLQSAQSHPLSFHDGQCGTESEVEGELDVTCIAEKWQRKNVDKALYGTGDLGTLTMTTDGSTIKVSYKKPEPEQGSVGGGKAQEEPESSAENDAPTKPKCSVVCSNGSLPCSKKRHERTGIYYVTCFSRATDAYNECIGQSLQAERAQWEQCVK